MRRSPSKFRALVDENPFSLSLGDLMAGLLLIFVLVLAFLMLNLREQEDRLLEIVKAYMKLREELYLDLKKEFEEDLEKWQAVLDREKISVRFSEPTVLFKPGSCEVQPAFQEILKEFFPRYLRILSGPKYVNNITEIRIEGHTSSEWSEEVGQEQAYILNMELSQCRTRRVLQYVLQIPEITGKKDWLKQYLTANGLSSSMLILDFDDIENKEESRRVEFRVRTNAEKLLDKLLGKNHELR